MSEGFARAMHGAWLIAESAGTAPGALNPLAVRVMGEAGVDISAGRSKHVEEFAAAEVDLVVTVCGRADQVCPRLRGAGRVIHEPFDDPPHLAAGCASEEEALPHYRRVRDEIRAFVSGRLPVLLGRG
ncbi:MAG: arsenate reductase ArsC [Phycisphaerales bacterium]|nr:arsenate reductase ArsC [Phycisphaerales bacterium]